MDTASYQLQTSKRNPDQNMHSNSRGVTFTHALSSISKQLTYCNQQPPNYIHSKDASNKK